MQILNMGLSLEWKRSVLMAILALVAFDCQRNGDHPRGTTEPIVLPSGDIPEGPASGTIDGKPYAVRTAIYTIDQRVAYQQVDIKLYSTQIENPCSTRDPGGPTVWLRRRGSEPLELGTVHVATGQASPWEVHYQVKDGRVWKGNGDAVANLVINKTEADAKIYGELSVAFGDASHSLVAGTFVAERCQISIDAPVRGAPALEQVKADVPEPVH